MKSAVKKISKLAVAAAFVIALGAAGGLLMRFAFAGTGAADLPDARILRTAGEGRCRTLDPIHADDSASRNLCGAVFDTLLAYDYLARPYKLVPSMLAEMPTHNADCSEYHFKLRGDLRFPDHEGIPGGPVTAKDAKFSLLRLADGRNHSPLYWMVRGKILGIDEFNKLSLRTPAGDLSIYDRDIPGIVIHDELNFTLKLAKAEPRFLYLLASPNAGIVSRRAVERFGGDFARHPVGSGPFVLESWTANYKLILRRNPEYRKEFFAGAKSETDRTRPLPLCDRIEILMVRQPMTGWMMFLQGDLDINALDKDNFSLVVSGNGRPVKVLADRGVRLLRVPEFEVRYIGFNFTDPVLGKKTKLRQALSLAYDVPGRVRYTCGQLIPTQGPLPEGVAGYDPDYRNPYAHVDLEKAEKLLAEAGYPGGIGADGKRLKLNFDMTGNGPFYRQIGELAAADFARIGIEVVPVMNNKPRFFEKLKRGELQLFYLSWIGDYPDAENFLQLFYSGNISGCNRTGFSDPGFDRMYETAAAMPDSPERTELFRKMVRYLGEKCVWIYEGIPVSYQLCHAWLENYAPHDFPYNRLKYLSVSPARRAKLKPAFTPLDFSQLSGGGK